MTTRERLRRHLIDKFPPNAHFQHRHEEALAWLCSEIDALKGGDAPNEQRRIESPNHSDVTPPPVGQAGGEFIEGTRIPPECVYDRFLAGESIMHLAWDFHLPPEKIEDVVRSCAKTPTPSVSEEGEPLSKTEEFRQGLPPVALRKVWANWQFADGDPIWFDDIESYRLKHYGYREKSDLAFGCWYESHWSFKPRGKSWSEVEILASYQLGKDDAAIKGCERSYNAVCRAIFGKPKPGAGHLHLEYLRGYRGDA